MKVVAFIASHLGGHVNLSFACSRNFTDDLLKLRLSHKSSPLPVP